MTYIAIIKLKLRLKPYVNHFVQFACSCIAQ